MAWKRGVWVGDPKSYFYPALYIYTLAISNLLCFPLFDPEMIGRFVSTLFGLLTALPAFLIGRNLYSRYAGILSAAFVSFGYIFVIEGRQPSPDSLQLFLFALSVWILFRRPSPHEREVVLGGLFLGFAIGTKWLAFFFCFPLAVIFLLQDKGFFYKVSLFSLAALAGFFISTPLFLVDWPRYVETQKMVWTLARSGLVGVAPGGFWGYLFAPENKANFFPTWASLSETMGSLWVAGVLVSLAYLIWNAWRGKNARMFALTLGIVVSYGILGSVLRFQAGRIILPLAFLMVIALSIGLDHLTRKILDLFGKGNPVSWVTRWVIRVTLPVFFLLVSAARSVDYAHSLRIPDSRLSAAAWVLGHIPERSVILGFINGPWFPPHRFDLVQWHLYESRALIANLPQDRPSLHRLLDERVDWVVWNETMTRRMEGKTEVAADDIYLKSWIQFKWGLDHSPCIAKNFEAQSPYSPRVEIYKVDNSCLQKNESAHVQS